MSQKEMGKSDLDVLNRAYPPASVLALNEIPLEYGNYRITQVAVKFMYDDGTNDNKGVHVDVPFGGSATVVASYTGCCRSYFCLMNVKVPGGQVQTVSNTANTPAGYCGGQVKWHLGIARQFDQNGTYAQGVLPLELVAD